MATAFEARQMQVRPLPTDILIYNMDMGEQTTKSGIVIQSDDGKAHGVKPRWAQVYCVGPKQQDIQAGQWVLVEHGRWSRGIEVEIDDVQFTLRRIDATAIMMVSDEEPSADDTISTAVHAERKTREYYGE